MSVVDIATPGGTDANEESVLLLEDVEAEVCVVSVLIMPRRSDAMAPACEDGSIVGMLLVEVEDDVDVLDMLLDVLLVLVLVVDMEVDSRSGREPSPSIVTVCVTGGCACGTRKFGAMLTAGCRSMAVQSQDAASDGTSRCGRLLYKPIAV